MLLLTMSLHFILGSVHINPFSNENGAILLRIWLSSMLQRQKRSPKTEPEWSEFMKTVFSSVDGENDAIWERWRHQNRHDRAPDHSTASIQNGGQTLPCGSSFDRRCSVDGRTRYENDKCGRKPFWKQSKTAPFSFENRLVWTGPYLTLFSNDDIYVMFLVERAQWT